MLSTYSEACWKPQECALQQLKVVKSYSVLCEQVSNFKGVSSVVFLDLTTGLMKTAVGLTLLISVHLCASLTQI
jgi:hypothetical protein